MRLGATGASAASRLGSAQVLNAGKFVPAVVDNVVAGNARSGVGTQLRDLDGENDYYENEKSLEQ
jgi:hypothetical protein